MKNGRPFGLHLAQCRERRVHRLHVSDVDESVVGVLSPGVLTVALTALKIPRQPVTGNECDSFDKVV